MEKIKKHFSTELSYSNVIRIYKGLKKSKQIELLRFFKAVVFCACANKDYGRYYTPDEYFSPHIYENTTLEYSFTKFKMDREESTLFGFKLKDYLGKY